MNTTRVLLTALGTVIISAAVHGIVSVSVSAKDPASGAGCIAIVMPAVQGMPGNTADAAGGIRDVIANYLTGPTVKVVALEARLPSQAPDEARLKRCEPLLFATVTRKSGGGRFAKALGQAAGTSSWYLPGGSTVASATARAASVAGLQTASALASSTKAKDEVRLEYRLQSADGQIQFGPKTERQTATVDGEDLLTPVVMRAAEAIVSRGGAR
jgi:hypothetical protein